MSTGDPYPIGDILTPEVFADTVAKLSAQMGGQALDATLLAGLALAMPDPFTAYGTVDFGKQAVVVVPDEHLKPGPSPIVTKPVEPEEPRPPRASLVELDEG